MHAKQQNAENPFISIPNHDSTTKPAEETIKPIAIIGFSIRFPEEANSFENFWKILTERRCVSKDFPLDRINSDAFFHPDTKRLPNWPLHGGFFMEGDLGAFDAPFFSITSKEAAAMDPQQRGLLETTYRALENAGLPIEKVSGTKTSVHTASFCDDYKGLMAMDPDSIPQYAPVGVASSILANRLSWFFDFKGPSVHMDSACSSSLMALDSACKGLQNGDSQMAVVAASNLILSPTPVLMLSNMNFLSPDSRCFSFDERANGYARGEGYSVVILKLLDDALKDNDTIRAVIRATSSNQDGRTPGITQPNRESQETLIREVYGKSNLDMGITRFVEAHGTGTLIGDPIEAKAIGSAFSAHRTCEDPLFIGAVKSNIGHLEGAAGMAGLIKTILVLERGIIPPNVFGKINPKIDTKSLRIKFPAEAVAWPSSGLRRASVNSFGFGGSNSHVILDDAYNFLLSRGLKGNHCSVKHPPRIGSSLHNGLDAPDIEVAEERDDDGGASNTSPKLLVWSAADEKAVLRLTQRYEQHFTITPEFSGNISVLDSLSYTLNLRRSSLPWKSFAVVDSLEDLRGISRIASKPVRASGKRRLCYVFTGQGANYARMGAELLSYPMFKASVLKSDTYLRQFGCRWSVIDELLASKDTSKVNSPAYSQPLSSILQIALVDLLRSCGLLPSAVVGHSSGEIAAAYAIGGLSHEAACQAAYFRGKFCAEVATKTKGTMMAIGLSEREALSYLELLTRREGKLRISIGCLNSPGSTTITGDIDQIDTLRAMLEKDSIFTRKLRVDIAYHSKDMDIIADEYAMSLGALSCGNSPGSATMVSSVTGKVVPLEDLCKSDYWVQNLVSPVRFSEALTRTVQSLKNHGITVLPGDLLEIGPHSTLQGPIKDILTSIPNTENITYTSLLTRFAPALHTTLQALGRIYCLGYKVDIDNVQKHYERPEARKSLPNLPEYPFDHSQIYWHESRLSSSGYRLRQHKKLDLLGTTALDWNPLEARWRHSLRISEIPWAQDHKVNGLIVYPGVGMLIMAIEGMRQLAIEGQRIVGYTIKDAIFSRPIPIPINPEEGIETQLFIHTVHEYDGDDSWSKFRLCILESGQWSETCSGSIQIEYSATKNDVSNRFSPKKQLPYILEKLRENSRTCKQARSAEETYAFLASCGLEYGPAFQRLHDLHCNEVCEATAKVDLFQWIAVDNTNHFQNHVIHPTTFDALAQLIFFAISNGARKEVPTAVPTRINKIWVSNSGLSYPDSGSVNVTASAALKGFRQILGSMFASDQITGEVLLTIEDIELTNLVAQNPLCAAGNEDINLFYNIKSMPSLYQPVEQNIWDFCKQAEPCREDRTSIYIDASLMVYGFMREAVKVADEDQTERKPHLQKYIAWMKHQVRQVSGEHGLRRPEWATLAETEDHEAVCDRIRHTDEGEFFLKVGQNLPQIIRGEVDPLEIFFRDNLVRDFYEYINDTLVPFHAISRYLEVLSHGNPQLNILEIGAGTGSTSKQVLASLFREDSQFGYLQYHFTDISPAFFEAARERFSKHSSRMTFKTLDIERDPQEQGFEHGLYDVVVGGLVLHATRDLNATLQNVRSLMQPGGSLILLELVAEVSRAGFAFGLLPGWWLSTEDYREWGPCISTQQWDMLFERNGFSRTKMEIVDSEGPGHSFSWLVAKACETTRMYKAINSPLVKAVTILVLEDSDIQKKIAYLLKQELSLLGHINCDIVSLQRCIPTVENNRFFLSLLDYGTPLLPNLSKELFEMLQKFLLHTQNLFWVKGGCDTSSPQDFAQYGSTDGLIRCLQSELDKLSVVTLWLQDPQSPVDDRVKTIIHLFGNRVLNDSLGQESEYIQRDGLLRIQRVVASPASNQGLLLATKPQRLELKAFGAGPPLKLKIGSPGFLDSCYFIKDDTTEAPLGAMEIEIKVKSVGINFVDLLTALGRIDTAKTMGCDCSGIVTRVGPGSKFQLGDRVCANKLDSFQTFCRSNDFCASKFPDNMSFHTAASLPIVFTTAYHSLVEVARIQPGHKVLIHAGAGGTGGAAIQIAQYFKAEVFTTVGSLTKKNLVMELYGIPEDHIFFSRNSSFAEDILHMTQGRGVDIIMNSLSGRGLISSWECIAPFGHFVEIGKRDILAHKDLPMFQFAKNVSFNTVDLMAMITDRPDLVQKSFQPVMDLIQAGVLKPITPLHIYKISELEDAFRYMQSGSNTGKIVIDLQVDERVLTLLDTSPTWTFHENSTYVVAGGLGGLGRVAAQWLVKRGARNLILLSRSGPKSLVALKLIQELKSQGARIETPCCDVSEMDSLAATIYSYMETMPPIKGCMQCSMVLKDSIFENMTFANWEAAIKPRIQGSWNLHSILPRDLDFFLLFSSVSGLLGISSQANYAVGSAYMDSLAHYRTLNGQKAVSLDLGWIETAGAVYENKFLERKMKATGHSHPISEAYFLAILEKYCDPTLELGSSVQVALGLQTPAGLRTERADAETLQWMTRNTFNHLDQLGSEESRTSGAGTFINYSSLFQTIASSSEAVQIVVKSLIRKLSLALLMPVENIDSSKPLYEYGVDSLLAVELRNWFSRELSSNVTVFDITSSANFETLSTLAVQRSTFKQDTWAD